MSTDPMLFIQKHEQVYKSMMNNWNNYRVSKTLSDWDLVIVQHLIKRAVELVALSMAWSMESLRVRESEDEPLLGKDESDNMPLIYKKSKELLELYDIPLSVLYNPTTKIEEGLKVSETTEAMAKYLYKSLVPESAPSVISILVSTILADHAFKEFRKVILENRE